MSDTVIALVTVIATAFAADRTLPRKFLVNEDTWETDDLIRDLAAVSDRPDDRFIDQHFGSLPVFTAEGLRHVLPQYLIYSVQHPESDATERIVFHLAPDDTESTYWRDRLGIFSPAQKSAMCDYLRHMQVQLAGQHYDAYLARGLSVWGCA